MSSVVKSTMVVGGKLKFKGSKNNDKKNKKSETKMTTNVSDQKGGDDNTASISDNGDKKSLIFITEAQRIHKEKRMAQEEKELKKFLKTSHRDRIEKFNQTLGMMTEHNDIPRISAAGNG